MRHVRWRASLIIGFVLLSMLLIAPTVMGDAKPDWWRDFKALPQQRLSLGLDLRGGVHMVYEVQVAKAAEAELRHLADWMESRMEREDARVRSAEASCDDAECSEGRIVVELRDEANRETLERILQREPFSIDEGASEGRTVVVIPEEQILSSRKDAAVNQAVEVIRNRIDQYGVAEPTIQRLDTGLELTGAASSPRVMVQLPGVDDPSEAKRLIQGTAQLEFRLIDTETEKRFADLLSKLRFSDLTDDRGADNRAKVDRLLGARLPEGSTWYPQVDRDPITRRIKSVAARVVFDEVLVDGGNLKDARVSFNAFNQPEVAFEFDAEGAELFADVTRKNKGKFLAIVMDDTIYSAPRIKSAITGGSGVIEGGFSAEEAQNLAIVLRAGALPAPLELLEERSVGPELGAKSVRQGEMSIALGGILVIVFMVLYYRKSGIIADVALILNLLFLMAILAGMRATLTLPGIAGIILTVGMAVDANVIIFERIREELRLGKSARAAIDGGYEKAMSTILDANITTVIAAIVLFQFGTGPVRGFAITLTVGVLTSVFCALVVTRTLFDYMTATGKLKTLSI